MYRDPCSGRTVERSDGRSDDRAGGRRNLLSADVEKETNQQTGKKWCRILDLVLLVLLLAAPKKGPLYGTTFFEKETWGFEIVTTP